MALSVYRVLLERKTFGLIKVETIPYTKRQLNELEVIATINEPLQVKRIRS